MSLHEGGNVASVTDEPRISSFMAADHAEALNGKLYLMGGGFDTVFAPTFPWDARFSLAAILLVPWNDTNRRFPVAASVETVDGEELGWSMQGELEAGRAPGKRGGETTIVLAAPVMFRAEEPVNFVLKFRFANDSRSITLALTPPPFPMAVPQQPPAEPE
jgi:hypothetical protein